ncbi:hypothetical protein FLT15_16845 [Paenibacillus thiaminolyticus]|uniref:hypothetical protein n=1 Tax=Paenibacillus thiaminolyticus TaxID=49283 RepID=UPI0013F6970E|nr:hypothetical protein [Paenibacillus thiaminolyticus]NGP59958.1 hypothetical protein [Paenibacillus thiaminolyticus]
MKKLFVATITVLLLIVVGCSSQGGEKPEVKNEYKEKEPDPESEQKNAEVGLKWVATYFDSSQGDLSEDSRINLSDFIMHSVVPEIGSDNKDKFVELSKLIKEDKKGEANKLFTELIKSYKVVVTKLPTNNTYEKSNKLQKAEVSDDSDSNTGNIKSQRSEDSSSWMNVIASLDSAEVMARIKSEAETEWKGDYEMQVYRIEGQTNAYNELKSLKIKNEVEEGILKDAFDEWNYDFDMVRYRYNNQMNAYKKITSLKLDSDVKEEILNNAISEWGTDYEMVLYKYDEQLKAYEKLK